MVYKADFKKGDKSEIDNFKPYLNINGYNYNSYIDKLLDNNFDEKNIRNCEINEIINDALYSKIDLKCIFSDSIYNFILTTLYTCIF